MNVGIVVEGPSDRPVYPVLMRRIRGDIDIRQIRDCGGIPKLKNRFLKFLREFHANSAWQIDVAFVIRDSDCKPPQPIENQLNEILEASGFQPDFAIEFFATQCVLESWLLADLNAIQTTARNRGRPGAQAVHNLQIPARHSAQDKTVFIETLDHFGLPATPEVYREIAALADFNLIGKRCHYFREFQRRVSQA